MKTYDVIVIGAGDVGLGIVFKAASQGLSVAVADKGNPGGTCVNYGCVPSKTLIHTADRITEIRQAAELGISAPVAKIDFGTIMQRMRKTVSSGRRSIERALEETDGIDFFKGQAHFLDDRTLAVGQHRIRGRKIFIASGSRPSVPDLKGLASVDYLTNETVLNLKERPRSLIIIGGGFVGVEYAHFLSAVGTKVTLIIRDRTLLPFEEPEISELLKKEMDKRMTLLFGSDAVEVRRSRQGHVVLVKNRKSGAVQKLRADAVMVSAGRTSNADLLRIENAGVETNASNYIKVDDNLRTNKKHIWALGDAIGRAMFTHAGDREAELVWHNAMKRKKLPMDFQNVPHAVYTSPQIASIGLTEKKAREHYEIQVGRAAYSDTVMGEAMLEHSGFAKAVVAKGSGRILGFHIIGPHAAILIQEVVNAVLNRADVRSITGSMHIFPALSNLVTETLGNLQ
ncbi:MAG: dihydrolipoyl dehydrogenase [Thermodesulfovibrionales bacterium]